MVLGCGGIRTVPLKIGNSLTYVRADIVNNLIEMYANGNKVAEWGTE